MFGQSQPFGKIGSRALQHGGGAALKLADGVPKRLIFPNLDRNLRVR